jgi:arginine-tRNA-protein transferase
MNSETKTSNTIRLFRTAPHACSYLKGKQATTVFVDPTVSINTAINSQLSDLGYRRSGAHIYRPDCLQCKACVSCRVLAGEFAANRRFLKILKRNSDLQVEQVDNLHSQDAYDLYCRYINTRHADGDMYPATEEQYLSFIATKTECTRFYKFRLDGRLVAVSIVDLLQLGMSAVYTFFDPSLAQRSLGTWVILWQIAQTRAMGLPYLYLGYWVKDCEKMSYKTQFRPLEMLIDERWLRVN